MAENILFVFEGEKTEKTITDSLLKHFIINDNRVVISSFKTDIYTLYGKIKKDSDLDAFALVKENDDSLSDFNRDSFSQLFLFFDYDGHSKNSNDKKILELLEFFNEETENGKLFISYPMVEALKCISSIEKPDDFYKHSYRISDGTSFKGYVAGFSCKSLIHFNLYDRDTWNNVVRLHCVKANFLLRGDAIFPTHFLAQDDIFSIQKRNFIDASGCVSTLGAFPLLLLDFFGHSQLSNLVSGSVISEDNVLRSV